jgi:hypothetical protein
VILEESDEVDHPAQASAADPRRRHTAVVVGEIRWPNASLAGIV